SLTSTGPGMCNFTCAIKGIIFLTRGGKARTGLFFCERRSFRLLNKARKNARQRPGVRQPSAALKSHVNTRNETDRPQPKSGCVIRGGWRFESSSFSSSSPNFHYFRGRAIDLTQL